MVEIGREELKELYGREKLTTYQIADIYNCCQTTVWKRLCFGKYFHNQNYWQLRISKKDSLLDLFRLIGPYLRHSAKKKGMINAKKNIISRNKLFNQD